MKQTVAEPRPTVPSGGFREVIEAMGGCAVGEVGRRTNLLYFAMKVSFCAFVANYSLYFATNKIFYTFVAKYNTILS